MEIINTCSKRWQKNININEPKMHIAKSLAESLINSLVPFFLGCFSTNTLHPLVLHNRRSLCWRLLFNSESGQQIINKLIMQFIEGRSFAAWVPGHVDWALPCRLTHAFTTRAYIHEHVRVDVCACARNMYLCTCVQCMAYVRCMYAWNVREVMGSD